MTEQAGDRAAADNARVEEAIAESFPASDAPSWTTGIERHGMLTNPGMKQHLLLPDVPVKTYVQYLRWVGASALRLAREMGPDAVLDELSRSGLRGRGGAGFPTAVKWRSVKNHECRTRYVVCNAAEGEPGTFKDRFLIRRNPYAMLEGILIAAELVDAQAVYIVTKASFVAEIARLRAAINELAAAGELGTRPVHVVAGPEEYLLGEEKALLEVVEGNDPLPREAHYPPYEKGLFATATSPNPALVNNVETFAHVPGIVRAGGDSFRQIGTSDTPGTLLVTVSGDVASPGVYELPAGLTLRRIFEQIAGGPRPGRKFKAAVSGVSSAVLTADRFDTLADFASLRLVGSGLGSAGFVVFDDSANMPRVAQALARFLYVESCNQCSACKHGLRGASHALDELFEPARATQYHLEEALYEARSAPQGNRCYLPVEGAELIPSLLARFSDEFAAQIASPASPSQPYLVPKIVDFDEATRVFTYDTAQARKLPDWSYADSAAERSPTRRAASPGRPHLAPHSVRLARDLREALGQEAARSGRKVETMVTEAIRAWLDEHGGRPAG
jgi:NADH:ubiquinone oxidoreductase subunit F (NADH-binding)